MENLITNYNEALKAIYEHVGFTEDWVVCPIDDCTDKYWQLYDDVVQYADSVIELDEEAGNFYENDIYKQRFYNKHVYCGERFTMIFCNPYVDGMKWFRIFDNFKKIM